MISKHATPQDFARWEEKATAMSFSELHYSIKDCFEAGRAIDKIDIVQAGKYFDEASCYIKELKKRKEG